MHSGRPHIYIETAIPAATRNIGRQVKRSRKIALRDQYTQCVLKQIWRDAQDPGEIKSIGAGQECRLNPSLRFDDIRAQFQLTETDYDAMRSAARRAGLSTPQYCRQAIVDHIAAPLKEEPTQAPSAGDGGGNEPSWLWLVNQ